MKGDTYEDWHPGENLPESIVRVRERLGMNAKPAALYLGDCIEVMRQHTAEGKPLVDAIVTDPPYGLSKEPDPYEVMRHWLEDREYKHQSSGFMGKRWDSFVPGPAYWKAAYDRLKPGGYLLAFGGTRTADLLSIAIRMAGFEIRDTLMWMYGSGFPKGKSQLKPAYEPIIMARKPFPGSMAANVAAHGTGALNIDASRIASPDTAGKVWTRGGNQQGASLTTNTSGVHQYIEAHTAGRWPANVLLDEEAAELLDGQSGILKSGAFSGTVQKAIFDQSSKGAERERVREDRPADSGGASRFFYCAKASKRERGEGNNHPTVKPLAVMEWLITLVTPPGGTVLDMFVGSGTTGVAAKRKGVAFEGIDREPEYIEIAAARIERESTCNSIL